MTYSAFDDAKPSGSDIGTTVPTSDNSNQKALRDASLMGGNFKGWDMAMSGGTAGQPATIVWTKNGDTNKKLRATPTYGSGAGKDGNMISVLWEQTTDNWSTTNTVATTTLTYDTNGELTAATGATGFVAWLMGLMGKVYKVVADLATHVALTGASAHGLGTMSTQASNAVAITGGSASLTYEREAKVAKGNVAGSTAIDWAAGGLQTLTVTNAAAALTWSNLPSGAVGYLTLEVTNGAIATSLFTAQKPGGSALSWTNPGLDIVTLQCSDGATVRVVGFAKDVK